MGVTHAGDLKALLPSQLVLPWALLHSRWLRQELLYRARRGQDRRGCGPRCCCWT